jgi:hypothetical protein
MMLASTVALAAAASFPAPFVTDGQADVAIVYGSTLDLGGVTTIQTALNSAVATQPGSSGVPTDGDFVQLRKANNEFNLGDTASSFITTIDADDLGVILAEGVYRNDENEEFEYEQQINVAGLTLTHFADSDFNDEMPVIGFQLADNSAVLNYTLDFTPDAAEGGTSWTDFEGTTLEILGKEYYILSASNASGGSLELLDSANTVQLNEGETKTVQAGGNSYTVAISFIGANDVKLSVNGEVTPSLNEDDTYKLSSGDYVGIREILTQDYAGGVKQVEFSIGSGKIELSHGNEVQINGEDISDSADHVLNSYFAQSGTGNSNLDSLTLEWIVDDEMWLGFGTDSTELTMPGFSSVKILLGDWVTEAEEMTTVSNDGEDKFKLDTTVTDGDVSFNFLYGNSSNFQGIGKDSDELLVTTNATNPTISWTSTSKWFVATWISGDDHESYVLEVSDIDDSDASKNVTTIKSVASGSNQAISLDVGETDELGQISFLLNSANEDAETASITMSASSGTVYGHLLVTEEGMKIQLPWSHTAANYTANPGGVGAFLTNASAQGYSVPTSWVMNFTEETKDGDINSGESFTATLGLSGGETTVTSVSESAFSGSADFETEDGSDDFVGYVDSDLATRVLFKTGGDQDTVEITYNGAQAFAEVFVSETGVTTGSSEVGSFQVMDSELASSGMRGKNLIVVGGTCVNSVAQELFGLSAPACGPAWTAASGAGSGQWLVQTFAHPDNSNKVATLVAGYEQAQTALAAEALTTEDNIDIAAGMKYTGSTGTAATPVIN